MVSNYRICKADPQDETTDTLASVSACLHQLFFIKSNCNGRPAISDRLVTITFGKAERPAENSFTAAAMNDDNESYNADIKGIPQEGESYSSDSTRRPTRFTF